MPGDSERTASVVLPAFVLSLLYTLGIFDWTFISGIGPYWDHLQLWDLDRAQALIGWRHFAHDSWHVPIFWVPALGYPEGANIVFTDSIPLAALVFKVVFQMTGLEINYLGLWTALCYVMQGVAAAVLLAALGMRARIANLSGVLVALCAPILLNRFGHGALCAHFVILLALSSYFTLIVDPGRRWPWVFLVVAPAATLLVTSYLAVMVAALTAATVVESLRRRLISTPSAASMLALMIAALLGVMRVSGMVGPEAPSPVGSGYGHFSMNLLAPFFGDATSYTQRLFGTVSVDATGGQYEGFNYLGCGVLVLGAAWLVSGPGKLVRTVSSHPVLVATLALLSIYALGNEVFVGRAEVFEFSLPTAAMTVAGAFRSSGRFFWPMYYAVTFGLLAAIWGRFPGRAGLVILATVALVQYVETRAMRSSVTAASGRVNQAHFLDSEVISMADRSERLFIYPSWECTHDDPDWPYPNSWRAVTVELMLYTSGRALPSNSAYVSRGRKDCERERRSLPGHTLDADTLYVVRRADAPQFADDLEADASCRVKDAAFLCEARVDRRSRDVTATPAQHHDDRVAAAGNVLDRRTWSSHAE